MYIKKYEGFLNSLFKKEKDDKKITKEILNDIVEDCFIYLKDESFNIEINVHKNSVESQFGLVKFTENETEKYSITITKNEKYLDIEQIIQDVTFGEYTQQNLRDVFTIGDIIEYIELFRKNIDDFNLDINVHGYYKGKDYPIKLKYKNDPLDSVEIVIILPID
jgi:hypothetical protein